MSSMSCRLRSRVSSFSCSRSVLRILSLKNSSLKMESARLRKLWTSCSWWWSEMGQRTWNSRKGWSSFWRICIRSLKVKRGSLSGISRSRCLEYRRSNLCWNSLQTWKKSDCPILLRTIKKTSCLTTLNRAWQHQIMTRASMTSLQGLTTNLARTRTRKRKTTPHSRRSLFSPKTRRRISLKCHPNSAMRSTGPTTSKPKSTGAKSPTCGKLFASKLCKSKWIMISELLLTYLASQGVLGFWGFGVLG